MIKISYTLMFKMFAQIFLKVNVSIVPLILFAAGDIALFWNESKQITVKILHWHGGCNISLQEIVKGTFCVFFFYRLELCVWHLMCR